MDALLIKTLLLIIRIMKTIYVRTKRGRVDLTFEETGKDTVGLKCMPVRVFTEKVWYYTGRGWNLKWIKD